MKSNFRKLLSEDIKKIVDEDALLPSPQLGDPHYVDIEDDELDHSGHLNYDVLVGNPLTNPDDYVDYINEQCGCEGKSSSTVNMHVVEDKLEDMDPHEAYGQGYLKGNTFDKKGSSYMAKSQLHKISKYADKLYNMIPDHYDLEDWMRSKLSEISDDIGEVYHALDYRKHKGKI